MTFRNLLQVRFVRVTAILVFVAVLIHLTFCAITRHQLDVVERDIAAHGLPLLPEQVIPKIPEHGNAAHDYEKAFVLLSLDGDSIYGRETASSLSSSYQRIYENVSREQILHKKDDALRKDIMDQGNWPLNEQEEAWTTLSSPDFDRIRLLLIEAGRQPSCVFSMHWEEGAAMRMPMLQAMKQAASLLCVHALLSRQHGQDDAAMDDFSAALGMALHTQQIPLIVSDLYACAEEMTCLRTLSIAL